MSIGESGRIVIEIEPGLKKELHTILRTEGTNLKSWFLEQAEQLVLQKGPKQMDLIETTETER